MIRSFRPGEFAVSIWGMNGTSVTFYRVEKRTEQSVTLQEVRDFRVYLDAHIHSGFTATPMNEATRDAPFRRMIVTKGQSEQVRISDYQIARPWNGEPIHGSLGD